MSKPAWVIANVVAALQDLLATLETLATGNRLDPSAAAGLKVSVATGPAPSPSVSAPTALVTGIGDALVAIYNILPELVSAETGIDPSLGLAILTTSRAIGAAMDPDSSYTAFAAAADAIGDAPSAPTTAQNRVIDAGNAALVARLTRIVLLAPYAEAIVRRDYAARQDGITARADAVERFEREIGLCLGAPDADVAEALILLRDRSVDYLSRKIATLAPVVSVAAPVSLPAIFWAWRLYGDPNRATELVSRNDVAHPSFMPPQFEALAPSYGFSGQS